MARIVAVHGIGQQVLGEAALLKDWWPALRDGLGRSDGPRVAQDDVVMAFYGDVFRPPARTLAVGVPPYTAADIAPGLESELLMAWWAEAARTDTAVVAPDADDTLARAPRSVQAALRALSRSRFFSAIVLRSMVADLKQVGAYLTDPQVREAVRARVTAGIDGDTRVVVAHSLGSVVAYEALCALPDHGVRALVTLGSPLGIPMVFERLQPQPGRWPGGAHLVWTNIADDGDVVALVKDLRVRFGEQVRGSVVHNGAHAHDVVPYLTAEVTGTAIGQGLL
ncbi:hypothetical protein ACIRLA_08080 [Streptomyces sp. NPDC102364]|uniref:hypothetical protein n=1 Tax=Streptomyces sp. NPDC102364 TaxID=3366161 RepID=UPI00381ED5CE